MPSPAARNPSSALIDHLARLARARSAEALAGCGLRPRHLVALTVLRGQEGLSQQALAAAMQIDKTNLVGLLNELESNGLVARRRSTEDRRRHIVEITDAGVTKLGEAESALGSIEDDVLGALSGEERETLYQLLLRATSGHTLDCSAAQADLAAESAA